MANLKIRQQIKLIECLDHLIQTEQTGSPKQLSEKLQISTASLFEVLKVMKQHDAPIIFDIASQSFTYETHNSFHFTKGTFYGKKIKSFSSKRIKDSIKATKSNLYIVN